MQTITLHNTRYELHDHGSELWRVEGERRVLHGRVTQCANCGAWVVQCEGFRPVAAEDQEQGRRALERHFYRLVEQDGSLT